MKTITLTTDFGEADHYVACMKGVILQHAPEVRIIDVTHAIRPHDVVHGAFVLRQILDHFPPGTIHVAVVDPGVGTARRLLAGRYRDQTLLAPDNGLVSLVHRDIPVEQLRAVENPQLFRREISTTFHGRDLLAPVAGRLAGGMALDEVGPSLDHPQTLDLPRPARLPDGGLEGSVLYIDHFGNLISSINRADLATAVPPHTGERSVCVGPIDVGPIRSTYADVSPGGAIAIIGSTGMLEIAVNQGNAAMQLRAASGTAVTVL